MKRRLSLSLLLFRKEIEMFLGKKKEELKNILEETKAATICILVASGLTIGYILGSVTTASTIKCIRG